MSEDAFHRDDPAGVLLTRAINHSHAAAADLLQNFVMTEPRACVGHVRFYEDALESFARPLPFGFKVRAQETVDARLVIKLRHPAALWALPGRLDFVRNGISWRRR